MKSVRTAQRVGTAQKCAKKRWARHLRKLQEGREEGRPRGLQREMPDVHESLGSTNIKDASWIKSDTVTEEDLGGKGK